jgi:hypothetical protein
MLTKMHGKTKIKIHRRTKSSVMNSNSVKAIIMYREGFKFTNVYLKFPSELFHVSNIADTFSTECR